MVPWARPSRAGAFGRWAPDGDRTRLLWDSLIGSRKESCSGQQVVRRVNQEMGLLGITLELHPLAPTCPNIDHFPLKSEKGELEGVALGHACRGLSGRIGLSFFRFQDLTPIFQIFN